jgi:hypothetical protein
MGFFNWQFTFNNGRQEMRQGREEEATSTLLNASLVLLLNLQLRVAHRAYQLQPLQDQLLLHNSRRMTAAAQLCSP